MADLIVPPDQAVPCPKCGGARLVATLICERIYQQEIVLQDGVPTAEQDAVTAEEYPVDRQLREHSGW